VGETERLHVEIEQFLKEIRDDEAELDRVLATVLFTDIVGSTERAAALVTGSGGCSGTRTTR
jgi:class 3 adenylate cyclase